jgi:hypothetical protein
MGLGLRIRRGSRREICLLAPCWNSGPGRAQPDHDARYLMEYLYRMIPRFYLAQFLSCVELAMSFVHRSVSSLEAVTATVVAILSFVIWCCPVFI